MLAGKKGKKSFGLRRVYVTRSLELEGGTKLGTNVNGFCHAATALTEASEVSTLTGWIAQSLTEKYERTWTDMVAMKILGP